MQVANDLSGFSPAAGPAAVIGPSVKDLDLYSDVTLELTVQGATGDVLDFTIETSNDGIAWREWYRGLQLAAAAAAITYVVAPSPGAGTGVHVGGGGTSVAAADSVLTKGSNAPGTWGKFMRVVYFPGAGTSAGAQQTIKVVGHKATG